MPFLTQGQTNRKFVAVVAVLAVIVGGGIYYFLAKETTEPVGCTMEAMRCPDGSYVGRIPPDCEFAECPPVIMPDEITDWQTYRNEEYGFEVKIPTHWEVTQYGNKIWTFEFEGSDGYSYCSLQGYPRVGEIDLTKEAENYFHNRTIEITQPFEFNGYQGIKVKKGDSESVFIASNGLVYNFLLGNSNSCDKIFSTFRFIEEEGITGFTPLKLPASPPFIQLLNNTQDVKIDFRYEGDYVGLYWPEPEFYTPEGSDEKFLYLSAIKKQEDKYGYGPEHHSVFSSEGSHWYGGSPIYLLNSESKYSVSHVGFKFENRELISELKIEFGIDYGYSGLSSIDKSESSIIASILGIEPVYACGPGLYLRSVGKSALIFVTESSGITWYRLENPIALYNLPLSYCDKDCALMPDYCHNWGDDPDDCWDYWCCFYNASISNLGDGNLRMHILYKPNDQEGFLRIQLVNLILSDPGGTYYQPIMGENFNHHYRAYLRLPHKF